MTAEDRLNVVIRCLRFLMFAIISGITTAALLLLALFAFAHPIKDALATLSGLVSPSSNHVLAPIEKQDLDHLIQIGRVVPAQDILAAMARYYEGMIQILILLFAVLGVLAAMYIRAVSIERAEEAARKGAEKAVAVYFESQVYLERIHKSVLDSIEDEKTTLLETADSLHTRADELLQKAEELENRMGVVEDKIASSDTAEGDGGGTIR